MKVGVKLARVGMAMEEATIVRWHKRPADMVVLGEALYEFETEKVNQEVTAPCHGRLIEIFAPEGATVAVGDLVCTIERDDDPA
jgi:pyruvate/2-oxoglutarate dehydrogenase complex dihydrolipoamide acyltransferase (E2) component